MPIITVPVENVEETVTREVVLNITYDLISSFGLPWSTKIMYPGTDDEQDIPIQTDWDSQNTRFPPSMKVLLRAEERYVDSDVATMVLNPNENKPIFEDKELKVKIAPVYAKTELTLSVAMRFPDKSSATKVRDDIRRFATQRREGLMHEVNYKYILPKVPGRVLSEIHRCREEQAGLGEDMYDWFNRCFSNQMTVISSLDKEYLELAKEEKQIGIMGRYDFEIVPEKAEPGESKQSHTLNFTYVLTYDRINSIMMQYPIMVHNVPLDSKYYDMSTPYRLDLRLQLPSQTRYRLDKFSNAEPIMGYTNGAPVPYMIDWQPSTVPSDLEGLLRIMVMVDAEDPRSLFNLESDLGYLDIRQHLLDYMKENHSVLQNHKESVVFIALYEGDKMLGEDSLTVDQDLNVSATFDLDLRKTYHVWVGLMTNWKNLEKTTYEALRNDSEKAYQLLAGIDDRLLKEDRIPEPLSDGSVRRSDFNKSIDFVLSKQQPIGRQEKRSNFKLAYYMISVAPK